MTKSQTGTLTPVTGPSSIHGKFRSMDIVIFGLSLFVILAVGAHLASVAVAIRSCRPRPQCFDIAPDGLGVSIVLPVCGIENHIEDTLHSAFQLDYPRYELIFCAARPDDPVLPLLRRLIADHTWIDARILIGDERISDNPKLNNVFKGWRETTYPFVSICDSNVLLPPDYAQRLFARYRPGTGMVCSPPVGCRPEGFFAETECAMLNAYQARWQYFADFLGFGFAQGKTLFCRKDDLEAAGGIRRLGAEPAEDAAFTKIMRERGLRIRLMHPPLRQPLGYRRARDVWNRQTRWARLRRASFPGLFTLEILSGSLPPLGALIALGWLTQMPVLFPSALFLAIWYGAEWHMVIKAGWHSSPRSLLCCLLRDAMLPALYVNAWLGRGFEWRGKNMRAVENAGLS